MVVKKGEEGGERRVALAVFLVLRFAFSMVAQRSRRRLEDGGE